VHSPGEGFALRPEEILAEKLEAAEWRKKFSLGRELLVERVGSGQSPGGTTEKQSPERKTAQTLSHKTNPEHPTMRHSRLSLTLAALIAAPLLMIAPGTAQQRQTLQTHLTVSGAQPIGRMPSSQRLNLSITLPLSNEEQLDVLLQQLYYPASPRYRQFLTVQQFTEQFGPSVVDYERVIGLMQSYGLTVTNTTPNRIVLDVSGTVAAIEQAFHVTMNLYEHPTENRTCYAPDVEPSVEAGFPVQGINGLNNYAPPRPRSLKRSPQAQNLRTNQTGSGPGGQFLGSDRRAAYYGGTALTGAGQVVGLFGLNFRMTDVAAYFNNSVVNQPLQIPVVTVQIKGVDTSCGLGCDDGEPVIDIIEAASMAPGLGAVIEYGASQDDTDTFNRMATDNIAKSLSASVGWLPADPSSDEPIFKEFAAQGQNLFVATGDSGAFTPPNCNGSGCNPVFYPADDPYITGAGGTDLTTVSGGGAWLSETAWSGSSGGYSTNGLGIPSWQVPVINSSNKGSTTLRNMPDVSAQADTDNFYCANGSCQGGIGGTSLSAPTWGGYLALVNEQAALNATGSGNPTLGFLNPTIYTIGQGANYDNDFHDITSGSDPCDASSSCSVSSYNAATGYDLVTGWGSPNGQNLINALAPTSTNPNLALSATPSTLPLIPGGAPGTSSIAVTDLHGFNATTDLTATVVGSPVGMNAGVAQGITAGLSAASIAAGGNPVTLTVSTTSATLGGNYIVAITGTSGGLTQTAFVTLAVPFFGLTTAPATGVSVPQSGSTNATVTIVPFNSFSGAVNLGASSGLPSGVTASFISNNATSSTATFTATSAATLTGPASPKAVSIMGTATGVATQPTGLNVFVNPPISGGSGTAVNLPYNLNGFYTDTDESAITTGLDGVGFAYSANLLNTGLDFNGVQFTFGPANQANAVYGTGTAIPLPAGTYATLQLLANGIEGPQDSQMITVTYTDSSTSTFTQSFSDWCSHLNGGGCTSTGGNPGESVAVAMPYRDSASGADDRVFYLYHYSFALNASKTVQSVTLPNNRNVVVLAATLTAPPASYSLSADATTTPSSVNAGSSSTATVTVTPANGYTGSVTLSCSISPAVSGTGAPTCSFGSTSPVSITGAAAVNATVTFATVGSTGNAAFRRAANNRVLVPPLPATPHSLRPLYASWTVVAGLMVPGLALIGLGFSSRRSHRKRLLGLSFIWIVSAGLILLPACGSGSSSRGGGCSAAPSVPSGLAASSTTSSTTTLSWTASTVSSGCSVTGYTVYQNGSSIATVTNPTYNVTGLTAGTQYSFSVAASDSAGASAQSTAINVTTLSSGTPSGTYTITITGKDANGVTQTGSAPTVTAVVN